MAFPKKICGILLILLVLAPITIVGMLTLSPSLLVEWVNQFSPYRVFVSSVDLSLESPRVVLKALKVETSQGKLLAEVEMLDIEIEWSRLLGGRGVVSGEVANGVIYPQAVHTDTAEDTEKSTGKPSGVGIPQLDQLLKDFQLSLSDIQVIWPQQQFVIESINPVPLKEQQGLDFSLQYQAGQVLFPVKGRLLLAMVDSKPAVTLQIPQMDLRGLSQLPSAQESVKKSGRVAKVESPIDWSSLLALAPSTLTVSSELLQIAQGDLKDIHLQVHLMSDHVIHYRHSGHWSLQMTNDYQINGPVDIEGQWQPLGAITHGVDLQGYTHMTFADTTVNVEGSINVNGVIGQNVQLNLIADQFPFVAVTPAAGKIQQQAHVWLPLEAQMQAVTNNQGIEISSFNMTANQSDLSGSFTVETLPDFSGLKKWVFNLVSRKMVLPKVDEGLTPEAKSEKTPTIFDDQPLDISWLESMEVTGQLEVDVLEYNNRVLLSNLKSDMSLVDGVLKAENKVDNLAGGEVTTGLQLKNTNNQLQLSAKGSINGLLLESLALLPEGEFRGGRTSARFALNSRGMSSREMASQLQGDFLLTTQEGIITNNSFEVIGSDLLLSILNTINPFHKKAKNTKLECAVVKSKIENGTLLFQDSVAIKTSKMIVVADGKIDLSTERINLGINPKARSGVGLDIASLAKFVALKGTLSDPTIGASGSGTLKSLVNIGAAVSTGGVSLLASNLFSKATSGDVCDLARQAFIAQ